MVSSPPVEVLADEDKGVALVAFTETGNDHVEEIGGGLSPTRHHLDEWALRQLASQAEQAADQLAEGSE